MGSLLEVKDYSITYQNKVLAVDKASFDLQRGEILAVVGESGSGKSTLIRGILGLLSSGGKVKEGKVIFDGKDLTALSPKEIQKLRGHDIAMIFQDAGQAMDPIKTVRKQFMEYTLTHQDISVKEAEDLAASWLGRLHLYDPARVLDSYPFELSGGMKQRVAIAMAMAQSPRLLLADEPTSALDVTVQAQVVYELERLAKIYETAIIIVTHNMGVASYLADHIAVMRNGVIEEYGSRDQVIFRPRSDYTKMLLEAVPKLKRLKGAPATLRDQAGELLKIIEVDKVFHGRKNKEVHAVDKVSLDMFEGECLGIVGESGCGKSTLARMVIGSYPPTGGDIVLKGHAFSSFSKKEKSEFRRNVQMVFQNPISSFSPRMTVEDYLYEPLRNYEKMHRKEAKQLIRESLVAVGLNGDYLPRLPHELSGGQLQRVAIARATLIRPELIVCDEATSALDVSIQNQVADLLISLQKKRGLSYLFIGHDLALIQKLSQRIVIMYLGELVEVLTREDLLEKARHPYTRVLLDAVFDVYEDHEKRRQKLKEMRMTREIPEKGCKFAPRCKYCLEICRLQRPEYYEYEPGHYVACHNRDIPDMWQFIPVQETVTMLLKDIGYTRKKEK